MSFSGATKVNELLKSSIIEKFYYDEIALLWLDRRAPDEAWKLGRTDLHAQTWEYEYRQLETKMFFPRSCSAYDHLAGSWSYGKIFNFLKFVSFGFLNDY